MAVESLHMDYKLHFLMLYVKTNTVPATSSNLQMELLFLLLL